MTQIIHKQVICTFSLLWVQQPRSSAADTALAHWALLLHLYMPTDEDDQQLSAVSLLHRGRRGEPHTKYNQPIHPSGHNNTRHSF